MGFHCSMPQCHNATGLYDTASALPFGSNLLLPAEETAKRETAEMSSSFFFLTTATKTTTASIWPTLLSLETRRAPLFNLLALFFSCFALRIFARGPSEVSKVKVRGKKGEFFSFLFSLTSMLRVETHDKGQNNGHLQVNIANLCKKNNNQLLPPPPPIAEFGSCWPYLCRRRRHRRSLSTRHARTSQFY